MGLQFFIIFILSLTISLIPLVYADGVTGIGDMVTSLLEAQPFSLATIPFLLFFTAILIAILPTKYTFYASSFVATIYYSSAFLVIMTNKDNFDLILSPFLAAWPVMIIIFILSTTFIISRYRRKIKN